MVRLIARERDVVAKAALRALSADFQTAAERPDLLLFVHADKSFNELCLSICGNEFVVGAMRLMQGPSRRFWFRWTSDA
jgi:DNA-binding GntR family transcriptional regulator